MTLHRIYSLVGFEGAATGARDGRHCAAMDYVLRAIALLRVTVTAIVGDETVASATSVIYTELAEMSIVPLVALTLAVLAGFAVYYALPHLVRLAARIGASVLGTLLVAAMFAVAIVAGAVVYTYAIVLLNPYRGAIFRAAANATAAVMSHSWTLAVGAFNATAEK